MSSETQDDGAWDNIKYIDGTLDSDMPWFLPPLHPIVDAFEKELCAIHAIHQFPLFISGMAAVSQAQFEQVCRECGIPFGSGLEKYPSEVRKWLSEEAQTRIHDAHHKVDPLLERVYAQGEGLFKVMSFEFRNDEAFRWGVHALLQAMVIRAWTAIEVLMGQMYQLAREGQPPHTQDDQSCYWRIMTILGVRGVMKAKEQPKEFKTPSLSNLNGIRMFYAMAFLEDSEEIDNCMCDEAFDTLNLLRNQLVHEAGRINNSFKKETRNLPMLSAYRTKGECIFLTGPTTKEILTSALKASVHLVVSVGDWLKKHRSSL